MDVETAGKEPSSENEAETKLIQETLQLLSFVTYTRVVVEHVQWDVPPKFLKEETIRQRSPRYRGQIYLVYQIPALNRLTPRGSSKPVKVIAKEVSPRYVNFYDKHVTLCRITSSVVDCWAHTQCEFKLYYCPPKKNMGIMFAKCAVPLSKILVLPFSFDSDVRLEMVNELSHCNGKLKVLMQLGSRMQHFLERVEPMRNPTTSVSPVTFLYPGRMKSPDRAENDVENNNDAATDDYCRCSDDERKSPATEKDNERPALPINRSARPFSPLSFARSSRHQKFGTGNENSDRISSFKPEIDAGASSNHIFRWKSRHLLGDDVQRPRSRTGAFLHAEERPPEPLEMPPYSQPAPEIEALSIWRQGDLHGFGFSTTIGDSVSTQPAQQKFSLSKHHSIDRRPSKDENLITAGALKSALLQQSNRDSVEERPRCKDRSEKSESTATSSYSQRRENRRRKSSTVADRLKWNVLDSENTTQQNVHQHKPKQVAAADPFSTWTDKSVNTSLLLEDTEATEYDMRRNVSDLFVDLTSRSYLSKKLKENIDELTGLIDKLQTRARSADYPKKFHHVHNHEA